MGFNSAEPTITLTAKLTPYGRQQLVSSNTGLITSFALGDSDANYYVADALASGNVPALAGEIGVFSAASNSVTTGVFLKSILLVDGNGTLTKVIEELSTQIITETVTNTFTSVSGVNLTTLLINRNNYNTDALVNLYYTFGLPLNSKDDTTFTGTPSTQAGFSDTAYSSLSTTKIAVIAIDNTKYGEMLDGKTIKVKIPTTAGTYNLYSTFQNNNNPLDLEDNNLKDTTINALSIGNNVVFLFSDDILKPNGGDASLSWATGYNTNRPFSINNKRLFNFQTNSNLLLTADTLVGMVFLDKGLVVITNPTIVNNLQTSDPVIISFNSVSTDVYQNITCIADRGEFGSSTNYTFGTGNVPKITEVGLFDDFGNLIAIAKTDRQITKNINEFLALGIKVSL